MSKDQHDKNIEVLQKMKDEILSDPNYVQSTSRGSRANTSFDPKDFNVQAYAYGGYESGEMVFAEENHKNQRKLKNTEGLRYPSIDDLLEVVDSKYKLAYIAAKRAKIIKSDHYSSVPNRCDKPVGMALEEILEGKVTAKF